MDGGVKRAAPAKVNLYLHVGPPAPDGYHPVESWSVFADVGDQVLSRPADATSLKVEGPFGVEVPTDVENLILKALAMAGAGPAAVTLDKRLPVAAGLGGGTSDAGAALLAARDLGLTELDDAGLEAVMARLGADGPLCLWGRAAVARGRGERLTPAPFAPPLAAVLVNPRAPSPTGAVYRAYDAAPRPLEAVDLPDRFASPEAVAAFLRERTRNDLETPAMGLAPAIGQVLAALEPLPGVLLTRMSGSGATCFALFSDRAAAQDAARRLTEARPDWWVQACVLA
ncbi:4-(cytidine 5'-diphospho)-2-C-methyl-D-erythritol kinase [Brevundimonas sp. 2R-24]|uniref:4-diphosphocytidyl-2-C-methyl-D-erythritol kinase n=1 Tax=Peiella sedimenti TaxID=3061083 RepID=A0ABT8SIW4_9CAUL|nr:4-(cytidine 5'-diphospho)-2-C-methyl-D-erythritol kinase [Caulobacteraceae bacterium XZ-24]